MSLPYRETLPIAADMIIGNEDESGVFAEANLDGVGLIFRFVINPRSPSSISSKIVNAFHEHEVAEDETYPEVSLMRAAVWSSVSKVWSQCITHRSIRAPDVTVEIFEDFEQKLQWRICHEGFYQQYQDSLLELTNAVSWKDIELNFASTIDYESLVHVEYLAGRGNARLMHLPDNPTDLYAFKGVDFMKALPAGPDFECYRDTFYHELALITSMPRHPNIIERPQSLVTVRRYHSENQEALICGMLHHYLPEGSLESQIQSANDAKSRLPLVLVKKWCYQMSSAIAHTYLVAKTFHMDIKPANFILTAQKDLILIDWEQNGAPRCTSAPEVDGTWDIADNANASAPTSAISPIIYVKYSGPPRENNPGSRPLWNVFPLWMKFCPRAVEAAEVYSLGRTMWMLFEQVTQDDVEEESELSSVWTEASSGIPGDWKTIVSRCLEQDPNHRLGVSELVHYWAGQQEDSSMTLECDL